VHKWNDRAELGVRLARVKGERIFLKDLDLRALLVVATLDAAYFGTNWTPLYAPASPLGNVSLAGNADISPPGEAGTMRIVAIQGAAEQYARQDNTVLANELRDKLGKGGGE
jgi:hypothetical protein